MNEQADISQKILDLVLKNNPENVELLIDQVEKNLGITRKTALEEIISLENNGKLNLKDPRNKIPSTFFDYLISFRSFWFSLTAIISIATVIIFLFIPNTVTSLNFTRYALGSVFAFFLPGYNLIKILYPKKEIDKIEKIALSIGTSIIIIPVIGILLNFTPWGIRRVPIALSIYFLVTILSTFGLLREYQEIIQTQE
ncbi:MAG: DUF1616 domain-containing protein [Candidatus Hodarchaeales archaeon]|jgi:hypothetical protein